MVRDYTEEQLKKMHHILLDRSYAREKFEEMFEMFGWLHDVEEDWILAGFSDHDYLGQLVEEFVQMAIDDRASDLVTFLLDYKDRYCSAGEIDDDMSLDDIFADEFALDDFGFDEDGAKGGGLGSCKPVYYQCGKTIEFGRYKATESGTVQPIEWIIIDRDGDKALVLSSKIIEIRPFNSLYENTSWDQSEIRQWLAGDFYDESFTEEEKSRVLRSKLINGKADGVHGVMNDDIFAPTQDYVFLLSGAEVKQYLVGERIICAQATEYVKGKNVPSVIAGNYRWWGRSMGINATTACVIDYNWINGYGEFVNSAGVGIRPAMWINLGAR